jgi:hypothetical protein
MFQILPVFAVFPCVKHVDFLEKIRVVARLLPLIVEVCTVLESFADLLCASPFVFGLFCQLGDDGLKIFFYNLASSLGLEVLTLQI